MSDTSGGGGSSYPEDSGQGQPGAGSPTPVPPPFPPPAGPGQPSYAAPGQGYPPAPGQGYPPPGQGYPPPGQGPGGYPGYPGYPGGGYDDGPTGWSAWAIAAFIVGLILPLIGILIAIPLGIVALVKIGRARQRGKVLAIVGMVLSVLWWVGLIALGVWAVSQQAGRDDSGAITKGGRIPFGDIREGDCISIPGSSGAENIDTFKLKAVPCAEAHNAEAVAVIRIDSSAYPGQASLDDQSVQPCVDAVSALPAVQGGGYEPYRLIPTEGIWSDAAGHRVLCFVVKSGFETFTGSLAR
ncbi:MAG: hypothetical protein WBV37_18645 [Nocardioidaceae bacterium]